MIATETVAEFNVEQFAELLVLLERVRNGQHTQDDLRPLQNAVEDCQPWLEGVLDFAGPQVDQRAEIEQGRFDC
jgi:hypothetical protein